MYKWILLAVVYFGPANYAHSQQNGMRWRNVPNWSQLKKVAKKENKYIFIYCGVSKNPACEYLEKVVFPAEKSGNYFNSQFVALRRQFDSTANDDLVNLLKAQYKVNMFPDFLFFSPKGELVHEDTGVKTVEQLLAVAETATDPERQYFTLLKKYQKGKLATGALRWLATGAQSLGDTTIAKAASRQYIAAMTDPFTKPNLESIRQFTHTSQDKGFAFFNNNRARADSVLGTYAAEELVMQIINMEEIRPYTVNKSIPPDWDGIEKDVTAKYGDLGKEKVLGMKMFYYENRDWPAFGQAYLKYFSQYGAHFSNLLYLNNLTFEIFQHLDDPGVLEEAAKWAKILVDRQPKKPSSLDTYANLLYKLGRKEEAVSLEQQAVDLAPKAVEFQEALFKMKAGKRTW